MGAVVTGASSSEQESSTEGASSSEQESSTDTSDDNDLSLRIHTLFLECVHTALANYFDQTLSAKSTTFSKVKDDIGHLYRRDVITESQYNLLSGNVSTSDLDITLIICLITHLNCFKLDIIKPVEELFPKRTESKSNTPIEADFRRLGDFWNYIIHQSSIKQNEFTRMWEETEAILLRINRIYPIANFKQTITAIRYRHINSFKQRRHRQTFSDRLFLLDPNDAYIYNEALKKGSGKDRFVRINVVGNYGQGKTSLTRRLLNQSLEGVESTDGIDVHVRKCKIKGKEWESSQSEFDENDCLEKLAEGTIRMKITGNITDKSDHAESKIRPNSIPSGGYTEKTVTDVFSNEKSIADNLKLPSTESEASKSIFATGENKCNKANIQAKFIRKYSSQLIDKLHITHFQ